MSNVYIGSIVVTKHFYDIGFVAKVLNGKPVEIFSRYDGYYEYKHGRPQ